MDNGSTAVGWLPRRREYVATAEGQFINCQTPDSMRELRSAKKGGNGEGKSEP